MRTSFQIMKPRKFELLNGMKFIEHQKAIHEQMQTMKIKDFLIGNAPITSVETISTRSPSYIQFLLGQQDKRWREETKAAFEAHMLNYTNDPTQVYIDNEIKNALQGIEINRDLLDNAIPVPQAGSVPIPLVIKELSMKSTFKYTTQAQINGPHPNSVLAVVIGTALINPAEAKRIARYTAELECRQYLPTPNATTQALENDLPPHSVTTAKSDFSASESSKDLSSAKTHDHTNNIISFFETCIGAPTYNSICSEDIKNHRYKEGWTKIVTHFTSPTQLVDAVSHFEKKRNEIIFSDPTIFDSESVEHYLERCATAEINLQRSHQFLESAIPTKPNPIAGGPNLPCLPDEWQLNMDQAGDLMTMNDADIKIKYPNSIIYRSHTVRTAAFATGACTDNPENEKVRLEMERKIANTGDPSLRTLTNLKKRLITDINLDPNRKNETIFLAKPIIANKAITIVNKAIIPDPSKPTKKHCIKCKKHRPEAKSNYNKTHLYKTHNTKDCKAEHGAMYDPTNPRKTSSQPGKGASSKSAKGGASRRKVQFTDGNRPSKKPKGGVRTNKTEAPSDADDEDDANSQEENDDGADDDDPDNAEEPDAVEDE